MISFPHLSTTLLYYVSWRRNQYLNRCVAASASDVVEALGSRVPISIEPILVELERGGYIGSIFPTSLADLVAGRRSAGGGDGSNSDGYVGISAGGSSGGRRGNRKPTPKVGATGWGSTSTGTL